MCLNTWSAAALGGREALGYGDMARAVGYWVWDLEGIAQPILPGVLLCWQLAESHLLQALVPGN